MFHAASFVARCSLLLESSAMLNSDEFSFDLNNVIYITPLRAERRPPELAAATIRYMKFLLRHRSSTQVQSLLQLVSSSSKSFDVYCNIIFDK